MLTIDKITGFILLQTISAKKMQMQINCQNASAAQVRAKGARIAFVDSTKISVCHNNTSRHNKGSVALHK
jgi:hypothetical protein